MSATRRCPRPRPLAGDRHPARGRRPPSSSTTTAPSRRSPRGPSSRRSPRRRASCWRASPSACRSPSSPAAAARTWRRSSASPISSTPAATASTSPDRTFVTSSTRRSRGRSPPPRSASQRDLADIRHPRRAQALRRRRPLPAGRRARAAPDRGRGRRRARRASRPQEGLRQESLRAPPRARLGQGRRRSPGSSIGCRPAASPICRSTWETTTPTRTPSARSPGTASASSSPTHPARRRRATDCDDPERRGSGWRGW